MQTIVEYVANYIGNLPEDHPACEVFGAKLSFFMDDEEREDNHVFAYRFPFSNEDIQADVMGDIVDVAASNRQGICVMPLSGGYPDAHSGKTYPAFVLRCRHAFPAIAYRTLYTLMYDLQDNARVFPQNGTIRALTSQPGLVWASSQFAYCYQAEFRSLVAEQVK